MKRTGSSINSRRPKVTPHHGVPRNPPDAADFVTPAVAVWHLVLRRTEGLLTSTRGERLEGA